MVSYCNIGPNLAPLRIGLPTTRLWVRVPPKASWLIKKHPVWATGGDNGASIHSAINEYLAIDIDGNCT